MKERRKQPAKAMPEASNAHTVRSAIKFVRERLDNATIKDPSLGDLVRLVELANDMGGEGEVTEVRVMWVEPEACTNEVDDPEAEIRSSPDANDTGLPRDAAKPPTKKNK